MLHSPHLSGDGRADRAKGRLVEGGGEADQDGEDRRAAAVQAHALRPVEDLHAPRVAGDAEAAEAKWVWEGWRTGVGQGRNRLGTCKRSACVLPLYVCASESVVSCCLSLLCLRVPLSSQTGTPCL